MITNSGYLTADAILELRSLKQKITSNPIIRLGITCQGKRSALDSYISSVANLMIMCSSFFQSIGHITDSDTLEYRFKLIRKIYRNSVFKKLYYNPLISSRMLRLFEIMQVQIEDQIFERIRHEMERMILETNGDLEVDKLSLLESVLDNLYVLAETSALHLSGQRINCFRIKEDIFEDTDFKHDSEVQNHTQELSAQCGYLNHKIDQSQFCECLHLFMVPDFFVSDDWMIRYFDMYYKYHEDPNNIMVILDYKLMRDYTWKEIDFAAYQKALNSFRGVNIINYNKIDFNGYKDQLTLSSYEDLPQCAYC